MTIELGRYKGLNYNKPEVEVLEDEIKLFLDSLLEQNKVEKEKTGGIEKDDVVLLDFDITHEGKLVPELSRKAYNLKVGNKIFYEDFEARLYGKKAGDKLSFNMVLPKDDTHNPKADKSIEVDLKILAVKESHLPELSDKLVSSFSIKDVNSIKDLKEYANKKIYYSKLLQESTSVFNNILKKILADSKVDLSEKEIDTLKDNLLNKFNQELESQGIKLDVYLLVKNISDEEHINQCREEAISMLKEKAVIEEIKKIENITLNKETISPDLKETDDKYQLYYQEVVKFLLKENTK